VGISAPFKVRFETTQQLIELLENTTLGTNGAKYSHLDTSTRILELDNPLFLSLERNNGTIGNVTFCRRGKFWYVRYFAFSTFFQVGAKKKRSHQGGSSFLKMELNNFFQGIFTGNYSEESVQALYAYIDPRNDRSKWMSENFGFQKVGSLATQTYSRLYPKSTDRFEKTTNWDELKAFVYANYSKHNYFFETHASKGSYYVLRDEKGAIIACAKTTKAHWKIERLPGYFGGVLTRIIPALPFLKKLIRPKEHSFLVPEIVCSLNDNPQLIDALFSAILEAEKCNLLIWWVDQKDPIYLALKTKISWGILDKLIGANPVDVVALKNPALSKDASTSPIFVAGMDMV
jgi:hypothetical protein